MEYGSQWDYTYKPEAILILTRHLNQIMEFLWVSIPLTEASGGNKPPFCAPTSIKLRLNHPKGHAKYVSQMRLLTRKHNTLSRLIELFLSCTHPTSPQTIK